MWFKCQLAFSTPAHRLQSYFESFLCLLARTFAASFQPSDIEGHGRGSYSPGGPAGEWTSIVPQLRGYLVPLSGCLHDGEIWSLEGFGHAAAASKAAVSVVAPLAIYMHRETFCVN